MDRAVVMSCARDRQRHLDQLAARDGLDAEAVAEVQRLHADRFGPRDLFLTHPQLGPALPTPGLIIHSADDERVPVDWAHASHRAWPGSQLFVVDGPNHRNTARDPRVIAKVLDYLS